MIDSHCHIGFDELKDNVSELVGRAKACGVEKMLTVACGQNQLADLHDILNRFPDVYGAFGIHPNESHETIAPDELMRLVQSHPKIIGIGETGLDYHYNDTPSHLQRKNFEIHLQVAKMLDLPVIIHSREAEEDTIELLQVAADKKLRGVFHCYTSKPQLAEYAMKIGFYVSASGVITFQKSEGLRTIFATIPLDKLLIETDSPYLAPVPYRGKVNEPSLLPHTAQVLADLKGVCVQEISDITSRNFNQLFFKDKGCKLEF